MLGSRCVTAASFASTAPPASPPPTQVSLSSACSSLKRSDMSSPTASLLPTRDSVKGPLKLRLREGHNAAPSSSKHDKSINCNAAIPCARGDACQESIAKRTRTEECLHGAAGGSSDTSSTLSHAGLRAPSSSSPLLSTRSGNFHSETVPKSSRADHADVSADSVPRPLPPLHRSLPAGLDSELSAGSSAELPFSPTTAALLGGCGSCSNCDSYLTSSQERSTPSSPPPLPSLQRIRQHELQASDFQHEEVLGEGSYSLVSLATHRASGLLFALKEIDRTRLRRLQLEPQLRWEINLQRTLRHPHIVRLYSYFITPSCISLVLEYCRGGTLRQRVRAAPQARLTEPQASRFTRHVAKALAHLHRLGVAHRDLKLENVLLTEDGIAKLADFGWSRPVGSSHLHQSSTAGQKKEFRSPGEATRRPTESSEKAGEREETTEDEGRRTVCGTLDYLSPEMVSGETHSYKTDVWSLGVMLAEMLTGVPPFYKESTQQTLHAIRCEAPNLCGSPTHASVPDHDGADEALASSSAAEVRQGRPTLSAGALSLIESMLQKDPARRPTINDVLQHPWLQKPPRVTH